MIAVEDKGTGIGRIRLQQIEDASGQSLTDAIKATIEPGSNIRTDGWRGYNSLNNMATLMRLQEEETALLVKTYFHWLTGSLHCSNGG